MQQRITLREAFELFVLDAKSRRFTASTLRFYNERLSLFLKWCDEQGIVRLSELDATAIRRYLVHLQERDLSSAYIHSHARAIRTFCNYCVRDGLVAASPFSSVRMPRLERKILPALTENEIDAILNAGDNERDPAIVLFMLDSGVRATELVSLDVGDVNMKTGSVTVYQGKGQKDRYTYIGARTRKLLRRYLLERHNPPENAPLFASEKGGGRLTYFGLAQVLKRLRKLSGVQECHAHTFRRTFAISCLRNGMDIFTLAKLMGHASLSVLQGYLDLVKDDLQTAHGKHGPVDNMT